MPAKGYKKEISFKELEKLCAHQCTLAEIACWFKVSEDTIERRVKEQFKITFAEYFEQKRGIGRISLRRKQMQIALGGNIAMLIFLGKQYLGQSDKQETIQTNVNPIVQLMIDDGPDQTLKGV
jgi:hypothetical protein